MYKDNPPKKTIKVFQGELMICYTCSKRLKSDPKIESGWTAVEVLGDIEGAGQIVYFCPECFKRAMLER